MINKRIGSLFCGVVAMFMTTAVLSSSALAYRAARVATDEADVKASPDPNAPISATLTQGTRVNTSDRTVNGYYRIRSATSSGWLPASALNFGNSAPPPPAAANSRPQAETMNSQTPYEQPSNNQHPWAIKALAGLDLFSPTTINNVIGSTGLSTGTTLGGQINYGLSDTFSIALRIEHLSKTTTGTDSGGNTDSISVGSTPVMVGIDWLATKGDGFSIDLGGYVGEGLSTQVSATNESAQSNNVTTYSGSAPTAMLAADLNWMVSDPFWIFGELGYRYLDTSSLSPSVAGANSEDIFSYPAGSGSIANVDINLSGVVLSLGVRINF